jgi:hypothetical protein
VRFVVSIAVLTLLAPPAGANLYWIAYEADDFPENEGWTRIFGDENGPLQGGAVRTIADGVLVIDSLRNNQIFDFYEIQRQIDPDPGELFIAEWRVRILENTGNPGAADTGVGIAPDGGGTLGIKYFVDRVISSREGWFEPIAPLEFHTYRVTSSAMEAYAFYIDENFVRNGVWDLFSLNQSFVNFGDGVQGARSLSEWDYVRFGVVPEPGSALLLVIASACLGGRRLP